MKKFGIAAEGITDQVTIEAILCGFFEAELEDEINYVQPKPNSDGGWKAVFNYLVSQDFRNDVLNHDYLIIQIDTDCSFDFGVTHDNKSIEQLIIAVVDVLILKINEGCSGFYQDYQDKLIFAISVHSLECWLLAHYGQITVFDNCFDNLRKLKFDRNIQLTKKYSVYEKLSQVFLVKSNIEAVAQKSLSFAFFVQYLRSISI